MSLINRMLQDLDKRGSDTAGNDILHAHIRAVPGQSSKLRLVWWWPALLLTAVLGAVVAWLFWRQAAPVPAIAATNPVVSAQPSQKNVPSRTGNMGTSLSIVPDQLGLQEKSAVVPVSAAPAVSDSLAEKTLEIKLTPVKSPAGTIPGRAPVATVQNTIPLLATKMASPLVPVNDNKATKEPRDVKVGEGSKEFKQAKEVTPQQYVENVYREAISLIDAGQLSEAIGALEQVLQRNPKHAAARQTLVGLLLEGKRQDEAVRKLEEGLIIDPTQSGMAMILARIQVEQSNLRPALETLQRSLPHAADQADYQAFLAALLQREKRHKEAIEHYVVALRKMPQNGLWWMGYGISLQADSRLAEAQDAFTRAKASNTLSTGLQAFVDQKLSQMQR